MENMETLTLTRAQRHSIAVSLKKKQPLVFYVEDSKEKEDRNETVPLPAGKKTHGSVIDAAFAAQFCLQDPPSPYIVSSKKSPSVAKYKSSITFTIRCGRCRLRFLMKTTKEEYRAKDDLKLQFPRCRCTSLAPVDQGEAADEGELDEQQNKHDGGDLPVIAEVCCKKKANYVTNKQCLVGDRRGPSSR